MRNLHIEPELLALLQSDALTTFTAAELLDAYRVLPHAQGRSAKVTRQFVQRNVARLTQKGVLKRVRTSAVAEARYQYVGPPRTGSDDAKVTASAPAQYPATTGKEGQLRNLKEKLHHYRVEMLTALGETEEYDAVCAELPQLRNTVQKLYNEARDRSSKTLGRVRALESIIANHAQSQS